MERKPIPDLLKGIAVVMMIQVYIWRQIMDKRTNERLY